MIKFNGKDTKEIYIGNKAISEVYHGDKLVWSKKPKVLDWSKCIKQTGAEIKRTGGTDRPGDGSGRASYAMYDEFSVHDSSGQEKYGGELTIQP